MLSIFSLAEIKEIEEMNNCDFVTIEWKLQKNNSDYF